MNRKNAEFSDVPAPLFGNVSKHVPTGLGLVCQVKYVPVPKNAPARGAQAGECKEVQVRVSVFRQNEILRRCAAQNDTPIKVRIQALVLSIRQVIDFSFRPCFEVQGHPPHFVPHNVFNKMLTSSSHVIKKRLIRWFHIKKILRRR